MSWQSVVVDILTYGLLIYSTLLIIFYISIGVISLKGIKLHFRKNSFSDFRVLATSSDAPGVTIIAPAYNEAASIVENARSLLSIYYENLEVIIVNDGSKDNSLERLIEAYDMKKIPFFVHEQLNTKTVRGIYKSSNPVFHKLTVVDKQNGGKADALNSGVNFASNDIVICIDVDCILEQDAVLRIIKPFLEDPDVICSGGVIRIANDCVVENGRLVQVNMPKTFLPSFQVLEYIRAFLLGRMAWSKLNGLLIVSGAFGAFNKNILIKAGGYDHRTVGEDMELIVRMRRYMEELGKPYKVTYIPDPLCWTEAPSDYKILGRQRSRWMRGTVEALFAHRRMFFNPNYHLLGMLSYPFWFFFEFLAPIIEFVGMVTLLLLAVFNRVDWNYFWALLIFIVSFGYLYSIFAIFMEVATYCQYKRYRDIFKLLLVTLLEPFIFHPFVVWASLKGDLDIYRNKKGWGEMTRKGFQQTKTT